MATGCFVSVGRSLDAAVERVNLAEQLGYEAVYLTHISGREPFIVLSAYALATERIRLGTGVTPIYTRTPANMAQTAASCDKLSGGPHSLGIASPFRPVVQGWYGQTSHTPVRETHVY